MIEALKQVEAGRTAEDVGQSYGITKHTIYRWKAKYGGTDASEAKKVKQLREENAWRKKLVAGQELIMSRQIERNKVAEVRKLYLDMVQRSLLNTIYEDPNQARGLQNCFPQNYDKTEEIGP